MRYTFSNGLTKIAAAMVLSCFVAGGVAAMTGPAGPAAAQSDAKSVNRTLKGDRLPFAARTHQHQGNSPSTQMAPASAKRAPLGCDPAFSPVVEPAMAHIFKRCMV
jgi:hypothetical protein